MATYLGSHSEIGSGSGVHTMTVGPSNMPAGWTPRSEIVLLWFGNLYATGGPQVAAPLTPMEQIWAAGSAAVGTARAWRLKGADIPATIQYTYASAETSYLTAYVFNLGSPRRIMSLIQGTAGTANAHWPSPFDINKPMSLFHQRFQYAGLPSLPLLTEIDQHGWNIVKHTIREVGAIREAATSPESVTAPHYEGYNYGSPCDWIGARFDVTGRGTSMRMGFSKMGGGGGGGFH